jgi:anti-sigma B factor antagonist
MGLGSLVRLVVSSKSAGCSLELYKLGPRVKQLMGLTHLLGCFTIIGEQGVTLGF